MEAIIGTVGLALVAPAFAAEPSPTFRESCRRLAGAAAYEWADLEHEVHISCLSAGVIPRVKYEEMVDGFSEECAVRLTRRLDPSAGGEVRIRGDEVTLMFIRHYDPLFRKFCAERNPGRGLVTDKNRYPEA